MVKSRKMNNQITKTVVVKNRVDIDYRSLMIDILLLTKFGDYFYLFQLMEELQSLKEELEIIRAKSEVAEVKNVHMFEITIMVLGGITAIGLIFYFGGLDSKNLGGVVNLLGDQLGANTKLLVENLSRKLTVLPIIRKCQS